MNSRLRELQIHQLLRYLREMRRYTQLYMARQQQISEACYSKLESGQRKLSVDRLISIAKTLNIPMQQIWFFLTVGEKVFDSGLTKRQLHYAVRVSLSLIDRSTIYTEEEIVYIVSRIKEQYTRTSRVKPGSNNFRSEKLAELAKNDR